MIIKSLNDDFMIIIKSRNITSRYKLLTGAFVTEVRKSVKVLTFRGEKWIWRRDNPNYCISIWACGMYIVDSSTIPRCVEAKLNITLYMTFYLISSHSSLFRIVIKAFSMHSQISLTKSSTRGHIWYTQKKCFTTRRFYFTKEI